MALTLCMLIFGFSSVYPFSGVSPSFTLVATAVATSSPAESIFSGPLKRSDVLLTARNADQILSTWQNAFTSYLANRVVWTYRGKEIIPQATPQNIPVQCTFPFWVYTNVVGNPWPPTPNGDAMMCRRPDGSPMLSTAYGAFPDINSEAWKAWQLAEVKKLVDAGCTSFMQDGAVLNMKFEKSTAVPPENGCYSNDSITKFGATFNPPLTAQAVRTTTVPGGSRYTQWVAFQKKSVQQYHQWLHSETSKYAKDVRGINKVYFSGNLAFLQHSLTHTNADINWLSPYFDFFMSEVYSNSQQELVERLQKYTQDVSLFPNINSVSIATIDALQNQRGIASAYALGFVPITAWDGFLSNSLRYCGGVACWGVPDPNPFAPFSRLVRDNPTVFDDYTVLQDDFYNPIAGNLAYVGGNTPYLVTVRNHKNDTANRAVHVVSWRPTLSPSTLYLRKTNFSLPRLPNKIVTTANPTPTPITYTIQGNYYTYPIPAVAWAVLYSDKILNLTPPTVSLTAPANNATVAGTVTFSANASDDVQVNGVQFRRISPNLANLGAEDTTPPYSVMWDTTLVGNIPLTIVAVARDEAGNRATSTSRIINVSNIPATCTLSATPTTITSGQSTTLRWTTQNAATMAINHINTPTSTNPSGIALVTPVAAGTKVVSPTVTTTYGATATGPGGKGTCFKTVMVN